MSEELIERVREAVIAAAQAGGGSYRRDIDCVAGNPTRIARAALEAGFGEMVASLREMRTLFGAMPEPNNRAYFGEALASMKRVDRLLSSIGASRE